MSVYACEKEIVWGEREEERERESARQTDRQTDRYKMKEEMINIDEINFLDVVKLGEEIRHRFYLRHDDNMTSCPGKMKSWKSYWGSGKA